MSQTSPEDGISPASEPTIKVLVLDSAGFEA